MAAARFCNSVADMMIGFMNGDTVMLYPRNEVPVSGVIMSITREDGSGLSYVVKVIKSGNVYTDVYVRFTQ